MGYTTDFNGKFDLNHELSEDHAAYLRAFADSRRMKRCTNKVAKLSDPIREKVGLALGIDGGYYVGKEGENDWFQPKKENSIIDYNNEPSDQPSLWCQWIPTEDNKGIEWDGSEKFYNYVEWLRYIIDHFLSPWDYILNGEVSYQGEDEEDSGIILVKNNQVFLQEDDYKKMKEETRKKVLERVS